MMRKSNLLIVGVAVVLAACSKKEMPLVAAPSYVANKPAAVQQVTWTQGDALIDGTYILFKKGTRQVLEVAARSSISHAKTELGAYVKDNFQQWNINDAGNGYFTIINAGSNKALETTSTIEGEQLGQNSFNGKDNQLWAISHQGLGLYKVVNKANNMAVTIENDASASGTKITQTTYKAASPQLLALTLAAYSDVTDSVTVDLSNEGSPINHVAAGFLHGFTASGGVMVPPDSLTTPLKINTVRERQDDNPPDISVMVPALEAKGIKQEVNISDSWSVPYGAYPPGPPGYNGNWATWDTVVRSVVNQVRVLVKNPATLEWDIWNEPDGSFWTYPSPYAFPGGYFAAWKHAYQAIRGIDPNAVITGPCYKNYDLPNLKLFISYCKANNCMPNYLTWHFASDPVQEVSDMTTLLADSGVSVNGFQINEYTTASQEYAGENAYLIAQLERAGVNAAMHAIWGSTPNGQLDGIIGPASGGYQKMATWWVYKSYGDINGATLNTTPGNYVDLVAGIGNTPETMNILLGTKPGLPAGNVLVKFINISPNVTQHRNVVHVKLQQIADVAAGTVTPGVPPTILEKDVVITYGSTMQLLISWSSIYNAYVFTAQ
jgi:hypothetical protein